MLLRHAKLEGGLAVVEMAEGSLLCCTMSCVLRNSELDIDGGMVE